MSNVKNSREKLNSVKKKDNENREGLMSMGRKKTFEDIMKLNMKVQKMLEEERKAKESGEDQVGEIKDEPRVVKRRIRSIECKLNDILRGVKGEKESFLPFVEDENGQLSNPKIRDFILELIDSHPDAKELSKEKRKLLELFFYCVILGPSGIKSEVSMEILAPNYICTEAFEEFIHAADDPVSRRSQSFQPSRRVCSAGISRPTSAYRPHSRCRHPCQERRCRKRKDLQQ